MVLGKVAVGLRFVGEGGYDDAERVCGVEAGRFGGCRSLGRRLSVCSGAEGGLGCHALGAVAPPPVLIWCQAGH